ncbi:hypothetical protein Pan216_03030 [Planctomycetes bacterium Pan216]|uniref:Uncharacterized protein n=1 Tax=Kolteria novifilia TaxID=2527975 RepID=A0A518AXM2_9BACT|nr:hypothetical protein Pan216_03030 [Planctomycetes bacterium Pan216]
MIHYTCDLCGKQMASNDKDRHVIHIEIRPADSKWELTEEDIDEDNLAKVSQLIKQAEGKGTDPYDDPTPIRIRYDSCPTCKEKFLKNPFNCKPVAKVTFSEN